CPQTPSAGVSALALGLPRLGARALLAPCGRCAAPMPPDPVGRRERPRARPPTPGGPCAARALRALRCSDAPRPRSAGVSALALGLPRLGARALLALCGRCSPPPPPCPVGHRVRSRPWPSGPGGPSAPRALPAQRCAD